MQLFIIEENIVKPNPETLLIPAFGDIWKRDKSTHKEEALKQFTFIEFMCSPKKSNPFHGYSEDTRPAKIIDLVFRGESFIPDSIITNAIEVYKELLINASPTLSLLESSRKAVNKLKNFLDNFDMDERNFKTGNPVYKPAEITKAINDTYETAKTLDNLQKKVEQEIYETVRVKGGTSVNHFER